MPIPEPLTIFTTVVSILTLVRNSIQTLYKDKAEWDTYAYRHGALVTRIEKLRDDMEQWQRRWMIWSQDAELFKLFWPGTTETTGHIPIINQLKEIEEYSRRLDRKLLAYNIHNDPSKRYLKKLANTLLGRLSIIESQIGYAESSVTALNRTANKTFCSEPTRMSRYSDFQDLQQGDIHKLGYYHLLSRLASESFEASNDLHWNCNHSHAHLRMYLELNFFGPDIKSVDQLPPGQDLPPVDNPALSSVPEMLKSLAQSAVGYIQDDTRATPTARKCLLGRLKKENTKPYDISSVIAPQGALRFTFLSQDARRPMMWYRIRVTPARLESYKSNCKDFFHDAQRVITNRTGHDRSGLTFKQGRKTRGVVREELGNITEPLREPTPLQLIIQQNPTEFEDRDFCRVLRLRRAFQLAEFGMLFLGTSWIHCICICNIGEIDVRTGLRCETSFRYTVRILPVTRPPDNLNWALPYDSLGNCRHTQVPMEFQRFPLFHLGLVLLEVALDIIITNVRHRRPGLVRARYLRLQWTSHSRDSESEAESEEGPEAESETEHNVPVAAADPEVHNRTLLSLKPKLRERCIHPSDQDAYYNAVLKCLQSTWETGPELPNAQLESYFNNILYP